MFPLENLALKGLKMGFLYFLLFITGEPWHKASWQLPLHREKNNFFMHLLCFASWDPFQYENAILPVCNAHY